MFEVEYYLLPLHFSAPSLYFPEEKRKLHGSTSTSSPPAGLARVSRPHTLFSLGRNRPCPRPCTSPRPMRFPFLALASWRRPNLSVCRPQKANYTFGHSTDGRVDACARTDGRGRTDLDRPCPDFPPSLSFQTSWSRSTALPMKRGTDLAP